MQCQYLYRYCLSYVFLSYNVISLSPEPGAATRLAAPWRRRWKAQQRAAMGDGRDAVDELLDGELDGLPSWSDDDDVDEAAFVDVTGTKEGEGSEGRDGGTPPPIAAIVEAVGAEHAAHMHGPPRVSLEPEPEPEPEPQPELSLGQPVTVLPEEIAGPAVLGAGMKFNPARKKRCGQRGSIGEELPGGHVKVKFETPVLGHDGEVVRVDTQMLSFPRSALASAGAAPDPIAAPAPALAAAVSAPPVVQAPLPDTPGRPALSALADEEEVPLEIEDYTCVSPWENFIHDVAEALRAWAKTPWPQSSSTAAWNRTTELTTPYEVHSYPELRKQDGEAIRVLLAHVRLLPAHLDNRTANEVFDDFPHEPGLLRQPMWSLHEAIRLCAYFGATEYIFVRPLSKMVPPNLGLWLASASLVALRNTSSPLPVYIPTGMSADAEYIGGTVGVGQVGCIGRRRCMVDTAPVPAAARTSGAVTTHMSFLLGLFDAKRAQVGCSGGQRRGPLVTEAAARFVFRCTASDDSGRSKKLATKHTFTLCTRWHSLPTPIESQELLAGLVDPWNAPVWTLAVDSAPGNPMEGRAGGIGALCAACKVYAQEFERQHGSLQGAATVAGLHHRQAGSATEQALEREQTRGHPSPEEIGAGALLQAVGGLLTGHADDIAPEAMVAMLRFSFSEKGLRGGSLPGGCPAESLLARFCWYMAGLSSPVSVRALLGAWRELVTEIRRHWDNGEMLPMGGGEDEDQPPDLASALLHQKLQMLNACVRWRRAAGVSHRGARHDRDAAQAWESEAAELRRKYLQQAAQVELTGLPDVPRLGSTGSASSVDPHFSETATGGAMNISDPQTLDMTDSSPGDEFHDARGGVSRRGAARQLSLRLISGELMWEPRTQMRVPTTSDRLREHEAKLTAMALADPNSSKARARMQAGEVISDMAGFKAANPGCCFEDFVRWFSPNDWVVEAEDVQSSTSRNDGSSAARNGSEDDGDMMATPGVDSEVHSSPDVAEELPPVLGKLSQRMTEPDNLWRQLWDDDAATAATPAAEQDPLFDYIAEAERVLHHLETVPPLSLLVQIVLAQGCAVNAWFASSPHSHHQQISRGLVALSQAVEELAVVHRQLQPADNSFDVMVNSDSIVVACSDLQAKVLHLDRLCGRAEVLATELTPSGGRFGAAALRSFQEELLGGKTVPVQRKSEREAVVRLDCSTTPSRCSSHHLFDVRYARLSDCAAFVLPGLQCLPAWCVSARAIIVDHTFGFGRHRQTA